MKNLLEIVEELKLVEMSLRSSYKKDKRIPKWEGYRDALLWVLTRDIEKDEGLSIKYLTNSLKVVIE